MAALYFPIQWTSPCGDVRVDFHPAYYRVPNRGVRFGVYGQVFQRTVYGQMNYQKDVEFSQMSVETSNLTDLIRGFLQKRIPLWLLPPQSLYGLLGSMGGRHITVLTGREGTPKLRISAL